MIAGGRLAHRRNAVNFDVHVATTNYRADLFTAGQRGPERRAFSGALGCQVEMRHGDHVALLRDAVAQGGVWADLGSGEGAFTLALADLIGEGGRIYSIERDASALRAQRETMSERFPRVLVEYRREDFTKPLDLPALDGIVMANSLHFYRDKEELVRSLAAHLSDQGRFVLVEYDADRGNAWVPYPASYATWERLSLQAGLEGTRLLNRVPSRFLGAIYSAVSVRPRPVSGT